MPKLKPEQTLYVRSMGKALKVTAMFTSVDETNEYLASSAGKDQGVVAEFPPFVFVANLYDKGVQIKGD